MKIVSILATACCACESKVLDLNNYCHFSLFRCGIRPKKKKKLVQLLKGMT